jgi:catechol 2,3-dioxygenase-like lactoylglutathione lyase family enzyme
MSRVQLALNVDDIDTAVAFYSTLFQAEPAKRRPGYANFALDEPALKLVLLENPGHGGSLNHLGVEVGSTDEVVAATRRLAEAGLPTAVEEGTTCCYALQDKVWATGPGGEKWEVYTVLADAGAELEGKTLAEVGATPAAGPQATDGGSVCCTG